MYLCVIVDFEMFEDNNFINLELSFFELIKVFESFLVNGVELVLVIIFVRSFFDKNGILFLSCDLLSISG